MDRPKITVVVAVLVALVFAAFAIGSANASKPEHWTDFTEFDWTYEDCVQDGAPVIIPGHLAEAYDVTVFFDKNGDPLSALVLARGTASLTYNGHTVTMHDVLNNSQTWPGPNQTVMDIKGSDWIGTVPGHGPILGIAGHQISLETCPPEGGDCESVTLKFSGMEFTDYETMCNYLLYGE